MKYSIRFQKSALKFIRKQNKKIQERLLSTINQLPSGTDIKKLQGYKDLYRIRAGSCRILYTIDNDNYIIQIEDIDYRGDAYKGI